MRMRPKFCTFGAGAIGGTIAALLTRCGATACIWPYLAHGLRLAAAVILALFISYALELDNAFWSGITAAVVCQPSLGGSLQKARVRVLGTVMGAVAIVALTVVFPQSRVGMLLGVALWVGICGFFATVMRNFHSYGAALAGFTSAVIFADVVVSPDETLLAALTRTAEICIGIGSTSIVFICTDCGNSRRRLAEALIDVTGAIATGIAETLSGGVEPGKERMEQRQFVQRILALDSLVDEAIGEAADLRSRAHILHAGLEGLFSAWSAWRDIANHIGAMGGDASQQLALDLHMAMANQIRDDWFTQPERAASMYHQEARRILKTPAREPLVRLLVDRTAEALLALQQAATGIALLTMPNSRRPAPTRERTPVADYFPAVLNGLRCAVAVLLAEAFWVETGWSGGQAIVTFTAVAVSVYSPGGADAYRNVVGYALGTIMAFMLATVVDLAIMPAASGFPGLALVLAAFLVPMGALSALPWRQSLTAALVVNFMAILSPQNQPTYDPAQFLNAGLPVVLGTILGALVMRLIPPLSPARRARRLMALTLRDLRHLAVGKRWLSRPNWTSHVSYRLEASPHEMGPEYLAQFLAALSLGEAVIRLRNWRGNLPGQRSLDRALACLAVADCGGASDWFADFVERQLQGATPEALPGMRARAAVFVIIDVLQRHGPAFGFTHSANRIIPAELRK
jgi:uncharacterized membrane protein YccC